MHPRLTPLLLLLFLPFVVSFPARPSSNVLHPRHIHQTFLQLKARRIRHATVHLASNTLSTRAQLDVSSRVGLAFEPCVAPDDCEGERSCVQLAGSTSGEVELTDCEGGLCFCADMEGCSSTDECLTGETCASGGTCVSNAFVPGAAPLDEADPALGLNLDPCQSISDCQNPRNCVQFAEGEFGQCAGPNCFCVRPDPSCTSVSECSQGESCTQREGSNNAICISETAIINGDATEDEIDEIPDSAPAIPPMEDMPSVPTATEDTEAPTTPPPQTTESPGSPETPATPVPVTPGSPETPATPVPVTPDSPDTPATSEEPEAPETPVVLPVPLPEESAPEEEGGPTDVPEADAQPEQADREPAVVVPGADGATVSPDTDEGEEVVPAGTDPETTELPDGEDGEILPSPAEGELIEPGVSSTPEVDIEDGGEEDPNPSPEDVICIGEHHLVHLPRDELLYSSNRVARVLCDENNSCATPGHIVMFNGKPMMMSSYCSKTTCAPHIMKVNSPRYRRAARLGSHTDGLSFTAFAARYGTMAEEHLLRTFVHMGL